MARGFTGRRTARCATRIALVPLVLLAAGCSGDDVQFEGKVFDLVGLNNPTQRSAEPKLRERAPLVVPPSLDRLPEPGQGGDSLSADLAALNDPDKVAKQSRADLERQQAEYCKVHYEQAKALGDQDADQAAGPLGPCRRSALTAFQNWSKDDEAEE